MEEVSPSLRPLHALLYILLAGHNRLPNSNSHPLIALLGRYDLSKWSAVASVNDFSESSLSMGYYNSREVTTSY